MNTYITLLVILSSLYLVTPVQAANLRACPGRVSGEWDYGRTPDACNASQFGDDKTVYATYPEIIFEDLKNRAQERPRYVEEAYATIQEAARYYIQKRNPQVSEEELREWVLAVTLVTAQESRMSQYRVASDKRLKLLRGDSLHGNGMMQLDDRSHAKIIQKGLAWNLITNLTYGMDILYPEWLRAPKQKCVGRANNWKARIRSTWAAYNGGPGSICRWQNHGSAWSRNDDGFDSLYVNPSWTQYLSNPNKASSINVSCLIEKKENCPSTHALTLASLAVGHPLIQTADKHFCITQGNALHCVDQFRDAVCLGALDPELNVSSAPVLSPADQKLAPTREDRHALCGRYDATVFAVGSTVQTQADLILRHTPSAGQLETIPAGTALTVLDFEVRQAPVNDRYYKVRHANVEGWIYAGNTSNTQTFVTIMARAPVANLNLATRGEKLQVRNPVGINLRDASTNNLLTQIPEHATLTVEDVRVQGATNEVFYQVNFAGHRGLIYSGHLLPSDTTALWTERGPQ